MSSPIYPFTCPIPTWHTGDECRGSRAWTVGSYGQRYLPGPLSDRHAVVKTLEGDYRRCRRQNTTQAVGAACRARRSHPLARQRGRQLLQRLCHQGRWRAAVTRVLIIGNWHPHSFYILVPWDGCCWYSYGRIVQLSKFSSAQSVIANAAHDIGAHVGSCLRCIFARYSAHCPPTPCPGSVFLLEVTRSCAAGKWALDESTSSSHKVDENMMYYIAFVLYAYLYV